MIKFIDAQTKEHNDYNIQKQNLYRITNTKKRIFYITLQGDSE